MDFEEREKVSKMVEKDKEQVREGGHIKKGLRGEGKRNKVWVVRKRERRCKQEVTCEEYKINSKSWRKWRCKLSRGQTKERQDMKRGQRKTKKQISAAEIGESCKKKK